jgi:hypothetical protein
MFGPDSGKGSWEGLNFMYEAVRVGSDPRRQQRLELFLDFWRSQGCRWVKPGQIPGQTWSSVTLCLQFKRVVVGNRLQHALFAVHCLLHSLYCIFDYWYSSTRGLTACAVLHLLSCRMVEMTCEEHDRQAASTQFVTHTVGRMLGAMDLASTDINTKGYENLLQLVNNTKNDSFELYYGLFLYNTNATGALSEV